ncbi:hypothetical protein N7535_004412 [Penicillium sp. DV-2018c]|nr:hypothetical protein N7461_007997 [Penicillium sp. DV-2018c]KAJ5570752.1 hypothetical protein N7535_004412 [Penicillium sp. DV-2018c]
MNPGGMSLVVQLDNEQPLMYAEDLTHEELDIISEHNTSPLLKFSEQNWKNPDGVTEVAAMWDRPLVRFKLGDLAPVKWTRNIDLRSGTTPILRITIAAKPSLVLKELGATLYAVPTE